MIIRTLLPRIIRRTSGRLLLTFISLMFGALTLSVVLGIIGSMQAFFVAESQTLLGGDITIETDAPIDIHHPLLAAYRARDVVFSTHVETAIVIGTDTQPKEGTLPSLLTSLKVIDTTYPLFGALETNLPESATLDVTEVLVAPDILVRMGKSEGDTLNIGKARFTIAGTVTREPDRIGTDFRLGPLVILTREGWDLLGIDAEQSRIDHILSLRFPDTFTPDEVREATEAIRTTFTRPDYRVSVATEGPASLLRTLDNARQFFFSMIVLALFLVIVNIRLNLIFFLASFQKTIAIMRSLGMRHMQLALLFITLLTLTAGTAGILGSMLGNTIARTALPFAEKLVGSALPAPGFFANSGIVTAFTVLLCLFSAFGFLERMLAIKPKLLLLGYGSEHGKRTLLMREIPALLITLAGLTGGIFYLTGTLQGSLIAVGSVTGTFILFFLIARLVIAFLYQTRFNFSFPTRSIVNFLHHQGILGTTAIASLSIAIASIFSIALIERNLLGNLTSVFQADAPNIYLTDVQEDQLMGVRAIMGDTWKDFAIIRGRFIARDGYNIQENLATEDRELRREFNLTARDTLIEGETITDGLWHGRTGVGEVSIEKEFAALAQLHLGSIIEFSVQGVPITATVTSIREVATTRGLPFFYLVYSPDVLEGFPRSSFGYAYIEESEIPYVQNKLALAFPNISSIPTTQVIQTIQKVVESLSVAVVAIAVPALALGLTLIIAMLALSARSRANDMLVFTVFGARKRLIFTLFILESGTIVTAAGFLALTVSYIGVYAFNRFVFDFYGFYHAPENALLFGSTLTITLIIALYFVRSLISRSPAELLDTRET